MSSSKALSLLARPGAAGIATRHIAILVADGVEGEALQKLHDDLAKQGAVPRFVGLKLGQVKCASGAAIDVEISMETSPAVVYDAVVLPDGQAAVDTLAQSGHALEFLKDQYRHCKTILALGAASALIEKAGIPMQLPSGDADAGVLHFTGGKADATLRAFSDAIAMHRHFARETDPPRV